jgi:hypothetical protein
MDVPVANYILLTDACAEKGYDLILKVAALLPRIPFVVIADSAPLEEVVRAYEQAGLHNITAIGPADDMDALYRNAAAVAVPSYRFLEPLGEVCLEAQRHAKPVIGSDRGNIPYLLDQSGVTLPEDPQAWAHEIERLFGDPTYYVARQAKARENAARYSQAACDKALDGIISSINESMLIGVGGGIGNMLHTTPMIRNIARRLGRRVDVVVTADHPGSLCLMHNQDYVGMVFSLRQIVLNRYYDTVFLTHSFGSARVAFNSDNVIWSSDWRNFRPVGMHETIYNLRAAQKLLGIAYDEEDTTGYFCGGLTYERPGEPLIGLHAGSKTGRWEAKRWPYFAELAARLTRRGFRVASFGTADEYVEGSENRTGATIEDMCWSMRDCSHFVSNDSGLMNIANALGIPVLALFAPTNSEARLPLRPTSIAIVLDRDCAPCELKDPEAFVRGQCRCMADIDVDQVEAKLLERIRAVA